MCGQRKAATEIRPRQDRWDPEGHCKFGWGKGEKFGSEVRPELVGKYEQNHPPSFHSLPCFKTNSQLSLLRSWSPKILSLCIWAPNKNCLYTLDIYSPLFLYQSRRGKKEQVKSKPVRIWLGREIGKPLNSNHFFSKLHGFHFATIIGLIKSNAWELAVAYALSE